MKVSFSKLRLSQRRIGKITASQVWKLFDEEERESYIHYLVAERLGMRDDAEKINYAFAWGRKYESSALRMVGEYFKDEVLYVDFIEPKEGELVGWFGATPDGYLRNNKLYVEVKSMSKATVCEFAKTQMIPERHKWQIVAGMIAADVNEWVYAMYHPDIPIEDRALLIVKYVCNKKEKELLVEKVLEAIEEVKKNLREWEVEV